MAARQAQAVSRVGRLRNQLVLAAKRAFPRAFGEAERSVGKRMSEVADEVLVAYLESFMGTSILAEEPERVADLRQALNDIGVFLPAGADLREWAEAIRRHGVEARVGERTPPVPVVGRDNGPRLLRNRDLLAVIPVEPRADLDLDDLFEPEPAIGGEAAQEGSGSVVEGRGLVEPLESAGDESRDSVGTGDLGSPHSDESEKFGSDPDIDFFDGEKLPEAQVAGAFSFEDGPDDFITGVESVTDAKHQDVRKEEDTNQAGTKRTDAKSAGTKRTGAKRAGTKPTSKSEGGGDRAIEEPAQGATSQPALPAWATGKTVKPQLFPQGTGAVKPTKRTRKPVRTKATLPDVPEADGAAREGAPEGGLSAEIREQLMASIAVPRPVFTSDLAALVGGEGLVSAWRDELVLGDLNVRFVLPKPRHRQRGSLVIPQAALAGSDSGFSRSHWARCMGAYRGARIYELGVFFHRFVEQVISFESDGETVAVRMSLQNGLTGAVLVAGQDLGEGGVTRSSIADGLGKLLQDRLVHVAVLVLNAEQFEAVRAVVEEEARKRGWATNMPVTLSRSWEYVEGTGTAVPLLGV